jgi:hypothetical protein
MIKQLSNHPKILLFLLALLIVSSFLLLAFQKNNVQKPVASNTRSSIYERFVPGVATEEDVVKVLGNPQSKEEKDGKTFYYYPAESVNFKNTLVFKNGTLYYSIENFSSNLNRSPDDYLYAYGQPPLSLNDESDDALVWSVYPNKGVGLGIYPFESVITKILYFPPQTNESFLSEIAPQVNLKQKGLPDAEVHESDVSPNGDTLPTERAN